MADNHEKVEKNHGIDSFVDRSEGVWLNGRLDLKLLASWTARE